jgi:hypothetical protein
MALRQVAAIANQRSRIPLNHVWLALAAPHPWLWATTLAIVAVDAVWLAALGISLEPLGFWLVAAGVAVLLAAAALWTLVKPEPTLRAMALSTAFLLAFTIPIAVLHYLAATLDRPLVDRELAAAEAALGFDWRAHVAFLDAHPVLARALALAYHSSGAQVALVVITLSALRRFGRLWRFVWMFAVTLFAIIAVSSLFPAEGPYALYMGVRSGTSGLETVGATWHLEPSARLRNGEAKSLAFTDMRGLATFPSFHVCLALITAWALAPIRILGPLALLINGAVVVATIGAGGHYLPDLLAGGVLGAFVLTYPKLAGGLRALRPGSRAGSRGGRERPAYSAAITRGPSGTRSMMRPG